MRGIDRLRLWVTPILLLVLLGLGVAYLFKAGILSGAWFASNKDILDAVNSLITSAVLLTAGILGYYKFFRGRTLTTRAAMELRVDVIDGGQSGHLHCLTVSAKNIGTVSILEPQLVVEVTARRQDAVNASETVSQWFESSDHDRGTRRRFGVIDSDETATFVAERFFRADVWAVTYSAVLSCTSGDSWSRRITVKNTADASVSTGD
ncbi:hypothetical protein Rhe02_21190 [Rhizocola hellebori]|uniref:Uncharacterized protein n=1 Tax=Rhizocola hellebori TaxID=1392758 RepID=A0A8J3Q603_9ACTN|nr:hypothetical protein [Rhizocola hellebori]GIH04052.1 hypothetical protein Rhe02_21190 [Rhizocola hellebori]